MDINSKINSFDPVTGIADISFWYASDLSDVQELQVQVPLTNGAYPTGADWTTYLAKIAPVKHFARKLALQAVTNTADIQALVGVEQSVTISTTTTTTV